MHLAAMGNSKGIVIRLIWRGQSDATKFPRDDGEMGSTTIDS